MKLLIWERVRIADFLPIQTNYIEAIIKRDLMKKVEFTQEEIECWDIKIEGITTVWAQDKSTVETEINLLPLEIAMLKEGFARLDKEKKIEGSQRFLALCEKIKGLEG